MRAPTAPDRRLPSFRSARALSLGLVLLLGSGTLTGCSLMRSTLSSYDTGPDGIARPQQRLREALERGDFPTALGWREDDALLRLLTRSTSAYYASQYLRAATLLDSAALLADDRITASLTRNVAAIVTNDNMRQYRPRRTERLFIAYYGMLAYAQLDQWEDAAVEARRLVGLIAQHGADRDDDERALHSTLEYLAAAVFDRAGRSGEAEVAHRAAREISTAVPQRSPRLARGQGEVVVVLERGFIAHRVSQQIDIFLGQHHANADSLRDPRYGDDRRGRHGRHDRDDRHESSAERMAEQVVTAMRKSSKSSSSTKRPNTSATEATPDSAAVAANDVDDPRWKGRDRRGRDHRDGRDDGEYWLAVAFPTLHRAARPATTTVSVRATGATEVARLSGVLDDAASADERRDRAAMLARATARAAAKYAITKAVKDRKGEIAGSLANFGVSLLERADVRAWHLLPQEIQLVRLRLPEGSHQIQLEVADGSGVRVVNVGPVAVRDGMLTIAPVRVWRDQPASPVIAAR